MTLQRSTVGLIALIAIAVGLVNTASAQLPSTVQLPSLSIFSYSGTVVVPDQGAAYLGGNRSSASGYRRSGLSRGLGSSLLSSQASVHATIIDHGEIDRQLLGGSPEEFMRREELAKSPARPRQVTATEEGKSLVRYARTLYREGRRTESFDTYRMAIRILPTGLRELATSEFERVFGAAATQAVRTTSLRR
jgi:hypothetical protein